MIYSGWLDHRLWWNHTYPNNARWNTVFADGHLSFETVLSGVDSGDGYSFKND